MVVAHIVSNFKTIYSVKFVRKVSGYSTKSDVKASRVCADAVLAGGMFHSCIVLGRRNYGTPAQ